MRPVGGLVSREDAGANLHAARPECESGGNAAPVRDAARGERRDVARVHDLRLNLSNLLSRGLTVFDLSNVLAQLRDDTALGSLSTQSQTLSRRGGDEEVTVETINQLPVNDTTQVADVAFVHLIPEHTSVYTRVIVALRGMNTRLLTSEEVADLGATFGRI